MANLPMSVLTTQTALTDRQNITLRSLPPSQNFETKRAKAVTKVTLDEPPTRLFIFFGNVLKYICVVIPYGHMRHGCCDYFKSSATFDLHAAVQPYSQITSLEMRTEINISSVGFHVIFERKVLVSQK